MIQRSQSVKIEEQIPPFSDSPHENNFSRLQKQIQNIANHIPSIKCQYPFPPLSQHQNQLSHPQNQPSLNNQFYCPFWNSPQFYQSQQNQAFNSLLRSSQQYLTAILKSEVAVKTQTTQKELSHSSSQILIPIVPQEAVENMQDTLKQKVKRLRYKQAKSPEKNKKKANTYYWNREENRRYAEHLRKYGEQFCMSRRNKKIMRINVTMSKRIKTRTPQQCHSHHQKMMKKFGTIRNIVNALGNDSFDQYKSKPILEAKIQTDPTIESAHLENQVDKSVIKIKKQIQK